MTEATVELTKEELLEQAQKAMSKTKIALMAKPDSAFFSSLTMSMKLLWSFEIPTAAASELTLYFNPKFFLGLTPAERLFLLLHETLHVALLHVSRLKSVTGDNEEEAKKLMEKWNKAADHVINILLTDKGYTMPEGGLCDTRYRDMHTEEVFKILPEDPPGGGSGFQMDIMPDGPGGKGSGNESGDSGNQPTEQGMSPQEVKDALDDMLVQAKTIAEMQGQKMVGNVPGELEIYIDNLINPVLPWHRILHKYFTQMVKSDYSFRKPNRRYFPQYLLPSQHTIGAGDIAVAVDTSGSVSQEEFDHFVGETHSILKNLRPTDIHFMQFDTQIKSVDTIKHHQDMMKVRFRGRGGTCIHPVIKWAKEHKPAAMVIFTDGYFDMQRENPKVPIIWVIHGNEGFTAPYGRVIHYQFKE